MGTATTTTTKDDHAVMELEKCKNELLSLPSSTKDLLLSLDKLEDCLRRATQSSSDSFQRALLPVTNALASKELLNHLDVDVRVSVASCFSQILRIIAPDVPFDDKLMKEIFWVIVSAFDNISEVSSLSYHKRVSILATIAEVRAFILMLDLECDTLIADMFNYFLGHVREYHPDIVFSSMGLIMILVLEEMEDIPIELLSTLLDTVRTKNQDILPIARTLGERVIENCDLKLAPYMHQALRYMGFPLKDYSKIVAHVCGLRLATLKDIETASSQDNASRNYLCIHEPSPNASTPGQLDPSQDRCLTLTISNGSDVDDGSNSRKPGLADEFPGQVAKTEAKRLKLCTTSPEASGYSLMKEARGTLEPCKACNEDVGTLEQNTGTGYLSSPQVKAIESSSGGALSTIQILTYGTSPGNTARQDATLVLSSTVLEGDGVMNELGGKQPENICVKVRGAITKERNKACQLLSAKKMCVGCQSKCRKDNSGEYFTKEIVSGIPSIAYGSFPRPRWKRNSYPEKGKRVLDLANGMLSGANLIGMKIRFWWPRYQRFYVGVIDSYDPLTEKHKVLYADGEEEMVDLSEEYWKPVLDKKTATGGLSTLLLGDDSLEM